MTTARVLWLAKGLGLGGAERLLTLVAAKLDRTRFEVEVAYLLPWKDALVPELEDRGVSTICLGTGTVRSADPRWVFRLQRLLSAGEYEIVHTHSPVPAVAARVWRKRSTILIHTEHNLWERYRWPTYVGNAVTYARNDAVLAVSDGVAGSVASPWWAPGRRPPVETLRHGVNPDEARRGESARTAARQGLGIDVARPVVGCVANLTPKKDHKGLLQALERVRQQVPDVLLLLIGAGPLEAELVSEVAARGLEASVRFLGSRDDVPVLLPALDVFVLASRYEGLPISLLEAMAAEVACVTTNVGGIPEVITDGVEGRLVPPGEPAVMAAALSQMLLDPPLRRDLAVAGRDRVRAAFSIDRAVRRTEELYTALLQA